MRVSGCRAARRPTKVGCSIETGSSASWCRAQAAASSAATEKAAQDAVSKGTGGVLNELDSAAAATAGQTAAQGDVRRWAAGN